jgi:hypothetical protein
MNNKWWWCLKERVGFASFELRSLRFHGGLWNREESMSRLRFEQRNSRMRVRLFTVWGHFSNGIRPNIVGILTTKSEFAN